MARALEQPHVRVDEVAFVVDDQDFRLRSHRAV
jgi:hypothetical protein